MTAAAAGALTPDATCPRCGEPVRWVMTVGGRRIPLNPDPHEAGTYAPRDTRDGRRYESLTGGQLPAQETAYRRHDLTCSKSREAARVRSITTPRCRGCGHALDEVLAAGGDLYHPTCAPSDVREHVVRAAREAAAARTPDDPEQEALPL